jgi:hypothetical protein
LSIGPKIQCKSEVPASSQIQGKQFYSPSREHTCSTTSGCQQQPARYITEPHTAPHEMPPELASDLLRGADEIAEFIFGDRGSRRKVYYLAECTKLPVFRLGSVLCARRSVLLNWIAGQESRVSPPGG